MNREIKFRGKLKGKDEWAYGFLLQHHNGSCFIVEIIDYCLNTSDVTPDTIGQFTGLHDKNGKEIYEGDILRVYDGKEYFNIIVKWSKEAMAFMACYCDSNQSPLSWFNNLLSGIHEIEIIGNIYDNKELEG